MNCSFKSSVRSLQVNNTDWTGSCDHVTESSGTVFNPKMFVWAKDSWFLSDCTKTPWLLLTGWIFRLLKLQQLTEGPFNGSVTGFIRSIWTSVYDLLHLPDNMNHWRRSLQQHQKEKFKLMLWSHKASHWFWSALHTDLHHYRCHQPWTYFKDLWINIWANMKNNKKTLSVWIWTSASPWQHGPCDVTDGSGRTKPRYWRELSLSEPTRCGSSIISDQ